MEKDFADGGTLHELKSLSGTRARAALVLGAKLGIVDGSGWGRILVAERHALSAPSTTSSSETSFAKFAPMFANREKR